MMIRMFIAWVLAAGLLSSPLRAAEAPDAHETAREVDRLLEEALTEAGVNVSPMASDEDFLRRITLDLAGRIPTPAEVTLFGINPDPDKRAKVIEELLHSDDYADNWSRYWRDVIFMRATEMRSQLGVPAFESWMAEQLRQNRSWSEIATAMLTATGDVQENGATGLIFAQGAVPEEVASEASRIFLGIQLQCANCHDHPYDAWKREQFHELAAFFPRVALRPDRSGDRRSFTVASVNQDRGNPLQQLKQNGNFLFARWDRDRNGRLTKDEVSGTQLGRVFDRLMMIADANQDGGLSRDEIRNLPSPMVQPGGGRLEYYMSDLNDPAARGTRIDPAFFVTDTRVKPGLDDLSRREIVSQFITAKDNPWFSRAYVNRIWNELLGTGFYNPIDDIGPSREPQFPEVLDALAEGFVASGYDMRWLFTVITNTEAYQRQIRDLRLDQGDVPFAAPAPTRLRGDQIYGSLATIAGIAAPPIRGAANGPLTRLRDPRYRFQQLFGYDPSTPQEDVTGDVPQALFLMNSEQVASITRATGSGRLARLVRDFPDDDDAVSELYLLVLSRDPSPNELAIAKEHIAESRSRTEAYEDLMWALLNSTEFVTHR